MAGPDGVQPQLDRFRSQTSRWSPVGNGGDQKGGLARSPWANGRAPTDETLEDDQSTRSSTTPARSDSTAPDGSDAWPSRWRAD